MRPYLLSFNDKDFLRKMRIAQDDDSTPPPSPDTPEPSDEPAAQ